MQHIRSAVQFARGLTHKQGRGGGGGRCSAVTRECCLVEQAFKVAAG